MLINGLGSDRDMRRHQLLALQELILTTFDVSQQQAHDLSSRLVSLAQGCGSTKTAPTLDWPFRVKQELGEKLTWRSDAERERFRLDQALTRHLRPPSLSDSVLWNDRARFRGTLKEILVATRASAADIEILKSVAQPSWDLFGPNSWWKHRVLKLESLIALIAVGAGSDPPVLDQLGRLAKDYLASPRRYDVSPVGLLILAAMDDKAAVPILRFALEHAESWSIRIACLWGLPESRQDGNYELIDNFRNWIRHSKEPSGPPYPHEWISWKLFMACLSIDGLACLCGQDDGWPTAAGAQGSPLIGWALDQGHTDWLLSEMRGFHRRGLWAEYCPLRNRMVERGIPGAVDFCLEQVKNAAPDDYTHYDVVEHALRLHPKPLPKAALDVCIEVIRHPCHPSHYKHRVEALHFLVEAVDQGDYPKCEVGRLVLELARNEADPDVRVAAIELVQWASPPQIQEVLSGALVHDSSQIREAALQALGQGGA